MKKKILVIFILIISYIILGLACCNNSYAINQTTTTDINSINANEYPQIKEMVQKLKQEHPNWNFKILYTDIEWNEAITNEYTGHGTSPRNLVPANNANYSGDWICKVCGADKTYDSGNWVCASEAAIAYMMDPRNSLNSSDIFQFMELSYSECNLQVIREMVKGSFLDNEGCINAIVTAAKNYNVNAYYAVARIIQEQGTSGKVLVKGEGYKGQYVGYYNVFNIGASGNGQENVILNGLKRAKDENWTSLEKSIDGGMKIIAEQYIAKGQNTMYLQKFDVENTGGLYWHQYMQNILAAQNEGTKLRKTFEEFNVESEYTFIIPVYKNMPETASIRPNTTSTPTYSELVRVNVDSTLKLRTSPNGSVISERLYANEIVTRIEKATTKVNGTYWDLVMKSNGTKGYAARETYETEATYKLYLVPVEEEKPTEPQEPETPVTPENPDNDEDITVIKNDKIKIDTETNGAIAIPGVTVKDVQELLGENVTVKNANQEVLTADAKLATGYKINDKYEVSVLGDVNGDGEINSGDLFYTQKYLLKQMTFDNCTKNACDVNKDNEINSGDLFYIQKYLINKTGFSV